MASYEKDVPRVLLAHGCSLVRQGKGDHEIWHSPINDRRFVVDGKIKLRHTANGIMKQAGIDHHFLRPGNLNPQVKRLEYHSCFHTKSAGLALAAWASRSRGG